MRVLLLASLLLSFCFIGENTFANTITAKSWLVADGEGKIIKGENTTEYRSIASISKLITAMIVLDAKQDLDEKITFIQYHRPAKKDKKNKKHKKQEAAPAAELTRQQLLDLALVHSDNRAAFLLCNNYPGGTLGCLNAINFKVAKLGMMHTSLSDPTGLDNRNVSTAEDLIKLVQAAATYPEIVNASKQSRVEIKLQKKWFFFVNTNPMIGKDRRIVISKTGFTNPAGGCIVMLMDTDVGKRIVVLLGSKNTHTRIPEAEFIVEKY
jgi:D-alanyl-D-alanine carboxypeptidase